MVSLGILSYFLGVRMSIIVMTTGRGGQCRIRFWTMCRISTYGVSVRIYSRRTRVLVLYTYVLCKEPHIPWRMPSFLSLAVPMRKAMTSIRNMPKDDRSASARG